jgi:hypothetical protein
MCVGCDVALPGSVLNVGPSGLFVILARWGSALRMVGAVFYHRYI